MFGSRGLRRLGCLYVRRCGSVEPRVTRLPSRSIYCRQKERLNHENATSETDKHTDTFSQDEIDKFAALGGQWWDLDGPLKPLHSLNALRVPFVRNGLVNGDCDNPLPLEGLRVLDVGCGGGVLSEPLARLGAGVTGLDVTAEGIAAAGAHAALHLAAARAPRYLCRSLEQHLSWGGGGYHAVVASEVLEHVSDVPRFLTLLCSALAPGGTLTLTTLNRTPQSLLGAIVLAEWVLGLVPRGTHEWGKFVPVEELRESVEKLGLRVEAVHGMRYNPVLDSWSWSRDVSVNYALRAVKPATSGGNGEASSDVPPS